MCNPRCLPLAENLRVQPKKIDRGYLGFYWISPPHFFIPAAVSYMLGLYRNFIRRIPLLSNIKVLHALDSQSHGFLARRDFGTWNSSNRDFGRSVWMTLCAIGFQIHRANASHVLGLSRNCTLPCICCPGPIDRKKTSAAKDCNWMRPILYILYVFEIFDLLWFFVLFCWSRSHCIPWTLEFYPDSSWFFRFLRLQRGMNQLMVGAILHPLELHSTTLDPGISTLCICRCKPRFVSSITSTKQHKIIIYIYINMLDSICQ